MREAAGLNEKELAQRAGLTRETVSRIETLKRPAEPGTVRALATALNVEPIRLGDAVRRTVLIASSQTGTTTGTKIGNGAGHKIGFWNHAPVVQQTVTGSRGGNAALASLLTALAASGLVVDSSSA